MIFTTFNSTTKVNKIHPTNSKLKGNQAENTNVIHWMHLILMNCQFSPEQWKYVNISLPLQEFTEICFPQKN